MPRIITMIIKQGATYVQKNSRGLTLAADYNTAISNCHL